MMDSTAIPYWRLSGFYLFYFAFLGAWIPFWNLYLEQELGFTAAAIGLLSAMVLTTRVVGPYLWGWLADHYRKRVQVIRFGTLVAFLSFTGVFFSKDFFWLFIVIAIYSFFWNAVLPQFEVVTLSHLKQKSHHYARIRLWGSVGFASAVFGLGYFFDLVSIKYLPHILLSLLGFLWISSLLVHEEESVDAVLAGSSTGSSFQLFVHQLKQKEVILFFVVCFLMAFSHGPYYTFYSIYLEELGYQRTTIGALWSLGVLSEIALFMVIHRLFIRFSLHDLLIVTLVVSAGRWFLIAAFPDYFGVLLFAQLLHAASFGSFHAIAVEMVRRYFNAGNIGQGQAFYNASSYGAGGALGAMLSGTCWHLGSGVVFAVAGCAVVLALVVLVAGRVGIHDG